MDAADNEAQFDGLLCPCLLSFQDPSCLAISQCAWPCAMHLTQGHRCLFPREIELFMSSDFNINELMRVGIHSIRTWSQSSWDFCNGCLRVLYSADLSLFLSKNRLRLLTAFYMAAGEIRHYIHPSHACKEMLWNSVGRPFNPAGHIVYLRLNSAWLLRWWRHLFGLQDISVETGGHWQGLRKTRWVLE